MTVLAKATETTCRDKEALRSSKAPSRVKVSLVLGVMRRMQTFKLGGVIQERGEQNQMQWGTCIDEDRKT